MSVSMAQPQFIQSNNQVVQSVTSAAATDTRSLSIFDHECRAQLDWFIPLHQLEEKNAPITSEEFYLPELEVGWKLLLYPFGNHSGSSNPQDSARDDVSMYLKLTSCGHFLNTNFLSDPSSHTQNEGDTSRNCSVTVRFKFVAYRQKQSTSVEPLTEEEKNVEKIVLTEVKKPVTFIVGSDKSSWGKPSLFPRSELPSFSSKRLQKLHVTCELMLTVPEYSLIHLYSREPTTILGKRLLEMYHSGQDSDIQVHINNRVYNLHSAVLEFKCNPFWQLIKNNTQHPQTQTIGGQRQKHEHKMTSHITLDAQQATINQFLIFLYSDVLQYPEPDVVATMPKIEIENRENQKFPDELELYCLAQQFNLPQLEHKAIKTIQSQVAKKAGKYLLRAHVQSQEGYKVRMMVIQAIAQFKPLLKIVVEDRPTWEQIKNCYPDVIPELVEQIAKLDTSRKRKFGEI